MTRLLRRRPSPAMVVALIALVLSTGGVSYGLATGSVDSREILNNTVRTQDVRNGHVRQFDIRDNNVRGRHINGGAVSSSDVSDNSLRGNDIQEATLGRVPLAFVADSANELGGDPAASFLDRCPAGTQRLTGSCIETAARAARDFNTASEICGAAQRRLPTASELRSARLALTLIGDEVTSNVFHEDGEYRYVAIDDGGALSDSWVDTPSAFRCVAPATNSG